MLVRHSTVTYGRSLFNLDSPIPRTCSKSSTLVKALTLLNAKILLAIEGPIPGKAMSSACVAVLRLIFRSELLKSPQLLSVLVVSFACAFCADFFDAFDVILVVALVFFTAGT